MRMHCDSVEEARAIFDALNHQFSQHRDNDTIRTSYLATAMIAAHVEMMRLRDAEMMGDDEGSEYRTQ